MFKLGVILLLSGKLVLLHKFMSKNNMNNQFIWGAMLFNVYLVYLFSYLNMGILILEGWLMTLLLFGEIYKLDSNYFLFSHMMVTLSFFSLSFTIMKSLYSMVVLFWILMLKSMMISTIILMFKNLSLGVLVFMLCSKGFVLFYGVMFKDFCFKEKMVESVYSNLGATLMILSWVGLMLMAYTLLLCGDLEGYFLMMLNLSHITVLLSCFFNLKMFFTAFLVDSLVFILFLFLKVLKVNPTQYSNFNGGWSPMFLFLFSSHLLGIPPFTSFFLEAGLIYSNFYFLSGFIKMFFLMLVYVVVVFQFCILFLYLGSVSNKHKQSKDLSSDSYMMHTMLVGVFMSLCFQFFMFYGV